MSESCVPVCGGAFESIPIIEDEALRRALAQQIRVACMDVGFFYVKNHGIAQHCLDEVLKVNKEYYSLPVEEKMKYPCLALS
ncbi:non-heme dioxygenase in morphine synthesis N-terminal-domain-containing protein [Suillus spraguei]|nr:non-heme dioxygenase in morphine synthesis N-terminal-domain-containing protein [Suillus spraguei]